MKSNEWQWIWDHKSLKIEIQKGGLNNSDFLENWYTWEITSLVLNLQKLQDFDKITPESCRMHWNLMNDKEFGSRKLFKLKSRTGYQLIQTFCKIGLPQMLGPPSLFCGKFKTLRKVLLNHAECIDIYWTIMTLETKIF